MIWFQFIVLKKKNVKSVNKVVIKVILFTKFDIM